MGLDQYAYAVFPNKGNTDFDYVWKWDENPEKTIEIAYWRKHPNLQGWMERLWHDKYEAKGLEAPIETEGWFAGSAVFVGPVRLSYEDLTDLESDIKNGLLPETTGFFFGDNSDDYYREEDLEFVKKAKEAISQDMEIYYSSSW